MTGGEAWRCEAEDVGAADERPHVIDDPTMLLSVAAARPHLHLVPGPLVVGSCSCPRLCG